ncbi:flagellar hook-basal body complex protein [Aliarcobacter skirrowii]|uniref:flagellar hook-basal body complex protein n=1 Tax=Aliarcobacter skirrowii TaxID=28200 RepID=UPI0029A5096B|nr:flagellar hook-basal body complex protein [Aliarcobacter skirrowii]MDX4011651.1 flagellar hook-basal body complex protein [Aliarcobacter skirrowii]
MIGSLWNGMSGIWQQDKGISIESNNIGNANTVGHKKDEISFSDLLYSQSGVGKGVQVQSISKSFTQGQIVGTGVGIDVAIEGKGFFVVKNRQDDSILYTRAGNLVEAKDGFLVTQEDYKIQGLVPQERLTSSTNPNLNIFTDDFGVSIISRNISDGNGRIYNINAKATDYVSSAKNDSIQKDADGFKTAQDKIDDIKLLIVNYSEKLASYQNNQSQNSIASQNQISQIDFSKQRWDLKSEGNVLSFNIDGRAYKVEFDKDINIDESKMEELYNFLSQDGRNLYNLTDPNQIQSQEDIDNMPITTPEEIALKDIAQTRRDNQIRNYVDAYSLVNATKELANKISSTTGYSATVKNGTIDIENLVSGKAFKISDIEANSEKLNPNTMQEAVEGSGLAMVESAKNSLMNALQRADAEFLEITNIMNYGDLTSYGVNDISVNLAALGISDSSLVDVSISDDGFVYATNGGHKFLVGRLSTVAFRNEQGLEAQGGNLYKATEYSGDAFNADSMNTIRGGSLERANVDYGSTLTSLMVYQKAFEANSKSITTSDEFLKTAIEMKR